MGLDVVELVMEIETTFGVRMADSRASKITTVGALFDAIVELLPREAAQRETTRYSGALWDRYLVTIEQFAGVPRERLVPSARFVEDLGLD